MNCNPSIHAVSDISMFHYDLLYFVIPLFLPVFHLFLSNRHALGLSLPLTYCSYHWHAFAWSRHGTAVEWTLHLCFKCPCRSLVTLPGLMEVDSLCPAVGCCAYIFIKRWRRRMNVSPALFCFFRWKSWWIRRWRKMLTPSNGSINFQTAQRLIFFPFLFFIFVIFINQYKHFLF